MTRKFIIISAILVFIVSPFIAWIVVSTQYHTDPQSKVPDIKVTPATKDELFKAVTTKKKEDHFHQDSNDVTRVVDVVSFENLDTWWYIVMVKYASYGKENPLASPMLVVKYYDGTDTIQVVTNPGEPLPFYNISDSSGIPYDVIDKYNEAISASQPVVKDEE